MGHIVFEGRQDAAEQLAINLRTLVDTNTLILGIARGGVVIAHTVSRILKLPLGCIVAKKIGARENPEFAIGAVAAGAVYWNEEYIKELKISDTVLNTSLRLTQKEVRNSEKRYLSRKIDIREKTCIVVDDGIATGATAIAAALSLKKKNAGKLLLATPIIAKDKIPELSAYFDNIVSITSPKDFHAVGEFYKEFPQVTDQEVITLLKTRELLPK